MWRDWPRRRPAPPTRIVPLLMRRPSGPWSRPARFCVGKTNLDQFATGLVGTRSPYGAVRCAVDPRRIAGGSSSGSAVAVALGQVDVSLGTDTAGSGRVPAALNGIVGWTSAQCPPPASCHACRSFDCVSVFAREISLAEAALAQLTGPRGAAPDRRAFPSDMPLAPPARPTVAVPDRGHPWPASARMERRLPSGLRRTGVLRLCARTAGLGAVPPGRAAPVRGRLRGRTARRRRGLRRRAPSRCRCHGRGHHFRCCRHQRVRPG